jgi:hypothetical protein
MAWNLVAGYTKAVWRWIGKPTDTITIGQIGGGQTPLVYQGMMNTSAGLLTGTFSDKNYLAGELSFVSSTTNNQSVQMDWDSTLLDNNGYGQILANIGVLPDGGLPPYSEGIWAAVDVGDGGIQIIFSSGYGNSQSQAIDIDFSNARANWIQGLAQAPVPKRCGGWIYANSVDQVTYATIPDGKCDTYVYAQMAGGSEGTYDSWQDVLSDAGLPTNADNSFMKVAVPPTDGGAPFSEQKTLGSPASLGTIISETYTFMNENSYAVTGMNPVVFSSGAFLQNWLYLQGYNMPVPLGYATSTTPQGNLDAYYVTTLTTALTVNELCVGATSSQQATSLTLGIYKDGSPAGTKPKSLISGTTVTISNPVPGWNCAQLPSPTTLSASANYWVAVLSTGGSSTLLTGYPANCGRMCGFLPGTGAGGECQYTGGTYSALPSTFPGCTTSTAGLFGPVLGTK